MTCKPAADKPVAPAHQPRRRLRGLTEDERGLLETLAADILPLVPEVWSDTDPVAVPVLTFDQVSFWGDRPQDDPVFTLSVFEDGTAELAGPPPCVGPGLFGTPPVTVFGNLTQAVVAVVAAATVIRAGEAAPTPGLVAVH